ncbi:MAG: TonB family protein [Cryobacterium sp.]|nr:TonB family protein [Oligoflexia bacterium]
MKHVAASLTFHAALAGLLIGVLAYSHPSVKGSSGKTGSPGAHLEMTVGPLTALETSQVQPKTQSVPTVPKPAPVAPSASQLSTAEEGIPIKPSNESITQTDSDTNDSESRDDATLARSLPTTLKNTHPRNIGASGQAGAGGENGFGNTHSDQIGNSNHSDALGIYLLKMHRKIQANLKGVGYIRFESRALLTLSLRKSGAVDRIVITTSSGDPNLDQKAINAVKAAAPFDPWESDQTIQVPVTFKASEE